MLNKTREFISRKSYNHYINTVIGAFIICGLIVIPIANEFDTKAGIRCSPSKDITAKTSLDFVQLMCFSKYEATYHWRISFGIIVLFNFALILGLAGFYSTWAKPRVARWDVSTTKEENPVEKPASVANISLFYIYVFHLFLGVFILLLLAFVLLYPINIPTNYSCPWQSPDEPTRTVPCVNPMAAKKMTLAKAVAIADVAFAFLILVEISCLFRWRYINEEFCVVGDMEFCSAYILRRRKNIGSIIQEIRKSQKTDVDFFIKLVIEESAEKRDAGRHEIYDARLEKPNDQIVEISDIFEPIDERPLRRILILGRPGIGKTVLTKRILQEWRRKRTNFWRGKLIIRFPFRKFNREENKVQSLMNLFSLGDGVVPPADEQLEDFYQFIKFHPEQVILVFDGLDELQMDEEKSWDEAKNQPNDDKLAMSVFSLYVKLIRGDLLPDVTIVTTSRRTAEEPYKPLDKYFGKKLEIMGFTKSEIDSFVRKFCKGDEELRMRLWSSIETSAELLSLCYIPVSCDIVCNSALEILQKDQTLSLTMTEIYRRYTIRMLNKHHAKFKTELEKKQNVLKSKELDAVLEALARIAHHQLDRGNMSFVLPEESLSLGGCGLLALEEDTTEDDLYSFPHLTVQEYLAAMCMLKDLDETAEFLSGNINVARWHLVIQFLAGLMGNEIRRLRKERARMDPGPERDSTTQKEEKLVQIIRESFLQWIVPLKASEARAKKIALLAVKCVHEIQDPDITLTAASKLDGGGDRGFNLPNSNIAPVDCRGLFQFLSHVTNLRKLDLSNNQISDLGVLELCKLLRSNAKLCELDISWNLITHTGVEAFCGVLMEGKSSLYRLNLRGNKITDEFVQILGELLKHENCKLTFLDVNSGLSVISDEGVRYICDALKHQNCKLTVLSISWSFRLHNPPIIGHICEALRHENCKLRWLNVGSSWTASRFRNQLEQASHVEDFQVF